LEFDYVFVIWRGRFRRRSRCSACGLGLGKKVAIAEDIRFGGTLRPPALRAAKLVRLLLRQFL